MKSMRKILMAVCIVFFLSYPTELTLASSDDEQLEEQTEHDKLIGEFEQLVAALESLDKYRIDLRFMNIDANQILAEGEIVGDQTSGDARFSFDIYEYDKDNLPKKATYDLISYREFDLVYLNTIEMLEKTGFFKQKYFSQNVWNQIEPFKNVYIPISGSELATANLMDSLYNNLMYLPNLDQLNEIPLETIYKINDTTIIDMERLEIPRGLFQNSGRFGLDYNLKIDINESSKRLVDYDVETTQRFSLSENTGGLTFKTNLESHITDRLNKNNPQSIQDSTLDYKWANNLSTKHVTEKLTKVTLSMNPETSRYSVTLTGLFEQFMLNIFSTRTADIESFNYRLELTISPTEEKIPELKELPTMTMMEFSYLMESIISGEKNRFIDNTQMLN